MRERLKKVVEVVGMTLGIILVLAAFAVQFYAVVYGDMCKDSLPIGPCFHIQNLNRLMEGLKDGRGN